MTAVRPHLLLVSLSGHASLHGRHTPGGVAELLALLQHDVAAAIGHAGGRIERAFGDEWLAWFDSFAAALAGAAAIREAAERCLSPGSAFGVRLVIDDSDAETAARLTGLARAGEILAGPACVIAGAPALPAGWSIVPLYQSAEARLAGPSAAHACRLQPSVAVVRESIPTGMAGLRLSYHERAWQVGPTCTQVSLGRGLANDLVVQSPKASRQHGRVSYRGRAFYYADNSSNGSFLQFEGAAEVLVHDDEVPLTGRGRIFFGASGNQPRTDFVEFEVV